MAGKAAAGGKTRNSDRRSGKAFAKNHNNPTKTLTEATIQRRAEHKLRVAKMVRHEPGSPLTMPDFDWDWFTDSMAHRGPTTRRMRTIEACIDQNRVAKKPADEGVPMVATIANSEVKESSARPSRKSVARAKAAERKNGR